MQTSPKTLAKRVLKGHSSALDRLVYSAENAELAKAVTLKNCVTYLQDVQFTPNPVVWSDRHVSEKAMIVQLILEGYLGPQQGN